MFLCFEITNEKEYIIHAVVYMLVEPNTSPCAVNQVRQMRQKLNNAAIALC